MSCEIRSPKGRLAHMKLCGQKSVIMTSHVRLIRVCQKRLIYPLTTWGEFSPVIRSRKLLREPFNGVPLWQRGTVARPKEPPNASKRPILGHSKKVQECGAVVGAGGTFCLEPEPPEHLMRSGNHSQTKLGYLSRRQSQSQSKFCRSRLHARDVDPESRIPAI